MTGVSWPPLGMTRGARRPGESFSPISATGGLRRSAGRARGMSEAREKVVAALIALLVQGIILLAGLSVHLVPEPSAVPVEASAKGVAELG